MEAGNFRHHAERRRCERRLNSTQLLKANAINKIHTANERRLGEVIGKDIAGKLHTGRSRNEQVVCDMRMWLRDRIREVDSQLVAFLKVIVTRAESEM